MVEHRTENPWVGSSNLSLNMKIKDEPNVISDVFKY